MIHKAVGPLLLALALGGALAAEDLDPLILPGQAVAAIRTAHLFAIVPEDQAEALRPFVARAEQIYVHMAADAGVIPSRLTLILDDSYDEHNGYSTTIPGPVVNLQFAPAPPRSSIFSGGDYLQRTLVHELAHHLSNDRNHGFRGALEKVFGRILPSEPLSLLTAYFVDPAHITMPLFWHEGLAQWAETMYADPASPWAGRGRDSLSHMVWRLDAADGGLPAVDDWRADYPEWPFGNRVYLYGLAYTRWLEAAYGQQASIWRILDDQTRRWPFLFDGGTKRVLGAPHTTLIRAMLADLAAEQATAIATLSRQPLTKAKRLTEPDTQVGGPAWGADGRLIAALVDPWGRDRVVHVAADGTVERTWLSIARAGEVRSTTDGAFCYADPSSPLTPMAASTGHEVNQIELFTRSRITLVDSQGGVRVLDGRRMGQPDLRISAGGHQVAAIHLLPAAQQELVISTVTADQTPWVTVPTVGRPWSPAFRPGHDELAWVEVDERGSRLVSAPLAALQQRTILAEVRGRLIHPAWTADGAALFVCADHSGVANAYRLDLARPGQLVPVTNTLGAVVACVPSPDGTKLAIVDYDRHGPFLAMLPNDPTTFPTTIPTLTNPWPAPLAAGRPVAATASGPSRPVHPLPVAQAQPGPEVGPYHGWLELRPQFWTPTTTVTQRGGYGIVGVIADPLRSNTVIASLGVGADQGTAVGTIAVSAGAGWLQWQAVGWRDERIYNDQIIDANGQFQKYGENVSAGEFRVGQGLAGISSRIFVYVAVGLSDQRQIDKLVDTYTTPAFYTNAPYQGTQRYVDLVAGYAAGTVFPTSYTREDGPLVVLAARKSRLADEAGSLERLQAQGSYVFSIWPRGGHQIVVGGIVGWSRTSQTWMQEAFQIGGTSGLDLPRGYPSLVALGRYLLGWTVAYRLPVWRPFAGASTTPFVLRQVVLEAFSDGAKASSDRPNGDGTWYRSVGAELHFDFLIATVSLDPGVGYAYQLDAKNDSSVYLALAYRW